MDHYKFKVGDIIKCLSNKPFYKYCQNKIGKIIGIDYSLSFPYLVEFFKPILYGHDGHGKGKYGYCWDLSEKNLKLYHPILKTFLKEKQNEI